MYTVDASVWVNAFDQREPGHLVSRQFLEVLRGQALPIIPTTTSVLDRLIFPAYAASPGSAYPHQEAEDVTGMSHARRGILHTSV
jgi:hypothetical protein